jgi:hypothetical protein
MGEGTQEVEGLNPAIYWMDVSEERKKNKESQMGHNKKICNKYSLT